ncbi:MAG TPA: hypothetical protein VKV16_04720 [Solirubrobacteraceae bacterium]|nr:hypothetical protein [Solirubrobacteraceae bacterium]
MNNNRYDSEKLPSEPSAAGDAGSPSRAAGGDGGGEERVASADETGAASPAARPLRGPSRRVTAVLAASMLAIGVGVGAAIGPAPTASFAGGSLLPSLLPSLLRSRQAATTPPAVSAQATPAAEAEAPRRRHRRKRRHKALEAEATSSAEATAGEGASEPRAPATSTPTGTTKTKTTALPPVTKVWLVELAGSSFSEASASPSAAPYIAATAGPSGTLLSGWSALQASAFANDAASIAGESPQVLDTIVQPPCPQEGAAASACATGTPGALTAADAFLEATLPTITSTSAYKENGLVVVTFASVANAAATGLPSGAASATLTAQPPAGALLISPFVAAGASSSVAFDPTSPKQSLEKLLRR